MRESPTVNKLVISDPRAMSATFDEARLKACDIPLAKISAKADAPDKANVDWIDGDFENAIAFKLSMLKGSVMLESCRIDPLLSESKVNG